MFKILTLPAFLSLFLLFGFNGLLAQDEKKTDPVASPLILELAAGAKMKLALIPAGKFQMGSTFGSSDEKPVHEVAILKPFYMGVTEVTQAQYQDVRNYYSGFRVVVSLPR